MSERPEVAHIRLLYIVRESFPTHRVDVAVLFARELAGRGLDIDFVMQAADPGATLGAQRWHGGRAVIGPTDSGPRLAQRLRRHWLGLWHEVRCVLAASRSTHDAVQVRDKILIAAIAAPVARLRRLKFFYWLSFPISESQVLRAREGSARYPALSWVRGTISQFLLYRWILPLSNHVFVQSEQMKRDVEARGQSSRKLSPVPMGVPREDVLAAPSVEFADAGAARPFLIGYLGTLNSQRRLEVLVEALAMLKAQGIPVRLVLVGDGDEPQDRSKLQRRAQDLGVEGDIEITGFLPRNEAMKRISAVDVGVSPFFPTPVLRSTSPTKLVEYFALGLPVVANDHPDQRQVLDGSRAGICVPWGARHFATALRKLWEAGPRQRRVLGTRGREWVLENRTYERIADRVFDVYRREIGGA